MTHIEQIHASLADMYMLLYFATQLHVFGILKKVRKKKKTIPTYN